MAAIVCCFLYLNFNKYNGYIKKSLTPGDILIEESENMDMLSFCSGVFEDYRGIG